MFVEYSEEYLVDTNISKERKTFIFKIENWGFRLLRNAGTYSYLFMCSWLNDVGISDFKVLSEWMIM